MNFKLIGLCLFFIFCLTLKGRKVGVSASNGKLVNSSLNLIHFKSPPKDAAEWEKAFFLLSSDYEMMKKDYEIMKKDYEMLKVNLSKCEMLKVNLSRKYKIMKKNMTAECKKYKEDCNEYKEEFLKIASVQCARRILEDMDLTLTYGIGYPKIAGMRKKLLRDKGQLDETAVSLAKQLGYDETERRMRWLYYMTYAETNFAKRLRKLLPIWNISAFALSRLFDKVYSICCRAINNFSVRILDVKDAETGFKMWGCHRCLLDCLGIIFELPTLTGFIPDEVEPASKEHEQEVVSPDLSNAKKSGTSSRTV